MMLEGYNMQINLLLDKLATLADSKLSKILVFLSFQIKENRIPTFPFHFPLGA
jgi:hypothetical protein